jgi:hypothetical protein
VSRAALALLLGVGLLQLGGELLRVPALKALGAASAASPAPRVFSVAEGLETYSTRFFLEWTDRAGGAHSLALTPQVYARLRGPYNRRNVYGAVMAYGPLLARAPATQPLYEAVLRYALCGQAPLLRELDIDPGELSGSARVRLEPRAGSRTGELSLLLEPACP